MIELSPTTLMIIGASFFVAGLVKGLSGMGMPAVAMGVLGGLMSPVAAAALLIVPTIVTNVLQFLQGPNLKPLLARLWPMTIGILAGTFGGIWVLTGGDTTLSTTALGFALIAFALFSLFGRPISVSPAAERRLTPFIGLASGLIGGATGVFVIPAVPFLHSLEFDPEDLIQALGIAFMAATLSLALALAVRGVFTVGNLSLSAFALIPALAGMWTGTKLRRRINPAVFRKVFLVCLLGLGLELVLRSVF
jgi:uncharacterized membrane protein YfcA